MLKPFSKSELLHVVSQAVFDCGWEMIYIDENHPFKIRIFNDTESYPIRIIIYNISHGGNTRSSDEYRIQIKVQNLENERDYKTLILGYDRSLNVFAAWDSSKHPNPAYSSSFQIRHENLQQASFSGFSPCFKENKEIAVAFKPDFFVEYVRNMEILHTFGESVHDFDILAEVTEKEEYSDDKMVRRVSEPRRAVFQTICKKLRDNSFRARVLRAYNNRCAFSGIQLKLVDAAHIVPVSAETSTDDTCNGIALSALYHRAYDKGLITFDDNYRIWINDQRMRELDELNLAGGVEMFVENTRDIIDVPPAKPDRPNKAFINEANKLRGWH